MALGLLARPRGDLAPSARTAYGSFPVLSARWRLIGKDSNGSIWRVPRAIGERPVLAHSGRLKSTLGCHSNVKVELAIGEPDLAHCRRRCAWALVHTPVLTGSAGLTERTSRAREAGSASRRGTTSATFALALPTQTRSLHLAGGCCLQFLT